MITAPTGTKINLVCGNWVIQALLAFFFGFCFVLSVEGFWKMLTQWRWLFLSAAIAIYGYRLSQPQMRVPGYMLSIESNLWIFSVLAFAARYLNRPSKALTYLNQAAYPVYILHMIFFMTFILNLIK
jgi:membrane-bound acyltransferase YfiQ involved in biofilm formation